MPVTNYKPTFCSGLPPFYEEYLSKGRMSDYELQKLIKNLTKQPQSISNDEINGLQIYNLRPVGNNNSYAGAVLAARPLELKTLKEAGIERVIDLVGYEGYESDCKSNGLEYIKFSLGSDYLNNAACCRKQDWLKHKMEELRFLNSEDEVQEFIRNSNQNYETEARHFITEFIDFINAMRKGNLYIGCEYGSGKTDCALRLNCIFNPEHKQFFYKKPAAIECDAAAALHSKLTPEDKHAMEYTQEFDESITERLSEYGVWNG